MLSLKRDRVSYSSQWGERNTKFKFSAYYESVKFTGVPIKNQSGKLE
jgi:hypothetical protein